MLVCTQPILKTWRPRLDPVMRYAPVWAALWCRDVRLSSAVNALEWDDPLNLKVDPCEGCGEPACAVGACVAVYRVHDDVVWLSAERWFEDYPADREAYWAPPAYLHRFGAVLFSRRGWDAVRAAAPHTPAVEALPELPDARLAELL